MNVNNGRFSVVIKEGNLFKVPPNGNIRNLPLSATLAYAYLSHKCWSGPLPPPMISVQTAVQGPIPSEANIVDIASIRSELALIAIPWKKELYKTFRKSLIKKWERTVQQVTSSLLGEPSVTAPTVQQVPQPVAPVHDVNDTLDPASNTIADSDPMVTVDDEADVLVSSEPVASSPVSSPVSQCAVSVGDEDERRQWFLGCPSDAYKRVGKGRFIEYSPPDNAYNLFVTDLDFNDMVVELSPYNAPSRLKSPNHIFCIVGDTELYSQLFTFLAYPPHGFAELKSVSYLLPSSQFNNILDPHPYWKKAGDVEVRYGGESRTVRIRRATYALIKSLW